MGRTGRPAAAAGAVTAALNYVVDTGEKLVNYPSVGGGAESRNTGRYEAREVTIRDGRRRAGRPHVLGLERRWRSGSGGGSRRE